MLIAKLNSPFTFTQQSVFLKTITKEANYFSVMPINYVLGSKNSSFSVDFFNLEEYEKLPSSQAEGEKEMKNQMKLVKRNIINLTNEELSSWGENDESLLQIVANKCGLVISEFINLEI